MAAQAVDPAGREALAFRVCATPGEFRAAAAGYRAGSPVPLLEGRLVRRDLARLSDTARPWRPADPRSHPVAVVPGDEFAPVGRILATATGRPLREVDLAALPAVAEGTLTVVCSPRLLSPVTLSGAGGGTAFLTARDLAAACALLLRTLVDDRPSGTLVFDPTEAYLDTPARKGGAAVTALPLTVLPGTGPKLCLAGRAHGRECTVGLAGDSLCARPPAGTDAAPADEVGLQLAACQHSDECVRRDIEPETALHQPRAHDLNAAAVLLDSCRSVSINGLFSTEVSLALAALDSTAVVVAGCPVTRQGPAHTPALFTGLLSAGLPAADVVRVLNATAGRDTYGDLVLLGDGARDWPGHGRVRQEELTGPTTTLRTRGATALRLAVDPAATALSAEVAGTPLFVVREAPGRWIAVHRDGTPIDGEVVLRVTSVPVHDRLRDLVFPTLDNLDRWRDHGLAVPEERLAALFDEATGLAEEGLGPTTTDELAALVARYEQLVGAVLGLQGELVDDWLDRIERGVDRYSDDWPRPVEFDERVAVDCPACATPAERLTGTAGLRRRTPLALVLCPLCGEVEAGAADGEHEVGLSVPDRAVRGQGYLADVRVDGPPDPALVSVGLAVSHRALVENRLRFRDDRLTDGKSAATWSVPGRVGRRASVDAHAVRLVAVVNGRPVQVRRTLWVRPGRRG